MHRALALLLAVTLAAAFPAAAQLPGVDAPCGTEASSSGTDCCGTTPAAADCQAADCAGAGAALLLASPDRGLASRITDSPEIFLARSIAPLARAPDTAPPKPLV
jgi:hypothetical protein